MLNSPVTGDAFPGMRAGATPAASGEFTLFDVVAAIRRRRRLVTALPIILAALVAGVTLAQPRVWVAHTSFMPQAGDAGISRLAGVAAQFGVAVPNGGNGHSPAFYTRLVESREILDPVADSTFHVGASATRGITLADHYSVPASLSRAARRDMVVQAVRDHLSVGSDLETGLVSIEFQSAIPGLGVAVLHAILDEVSAFNMRRRREQAAAERVFVEDRLRELRRELDVAEERRVAFLGRNRGGVRTSPSLSLEAERVDRDVAIRQSIYTSFAQAYEQARIDEVRNTPLITIVERPSVPTVAAPRRLAVKLVVSLAGGLAAAIMLAIFLESFERARRVLAAERSSADRATRV